MNRLLCPLLVVCGVFLCTASSAQKPQLRSDKVVPRWVKNPPTSTTRQIEYIPVTTYTNELRTGTSSSLNELADHLPRDWKVTANVKTNESGKIQQTNEGVGGSSQTQTYSIEVMSEGKPVNLRCLLVDEYWDQPNTGGGPRYRNIQLYQVVAPGANVPFEKTSLTTSYGGHGLWRSAIVPGWGQFYKGSNLKGGLVLGGTVALIAGIIYTNSESSNYADKILKTHITANKRAYATKRDNYTTGRNICIGGLAALYVYNIIDAIVAPGARRIVVHRNTASGRSYGLAPAVMDSGSPGLAATMTF